MDLLLSADETDLATSVERYLAASMSTPHLRQRLQAGEPLDDADWKAAGALGMFSLGLPEEAGGAGCPVVEEMLVFRALGRHLAPVGFLSQVIATRLAHLTDQPDLRDLLAAGTQSTSICLTDRSQAGPRRVCGLTGSAFLLEDRDGALTLFPQAMLPAGQPVECLDPSTELSLVATEGVDPTARLDGPAAEQLRLLGTLLSAAMLVGIAEAARDAAVAYAKQREQYGRLIGVNQAVKHPCAEMATRCEATSSLLFFAALALRDGRSDAGFQVAAAKRLAAGAAYFCTRTNVQVHGGMGVTWEHDAHLLVTRTHLLDHLFGDVRHQQQQLLALAPSIP